MDGTSVPGAARPRRPNARGQGELLRADIVSTAQRMLDELADDEALSLRAVARALSISPTSVYLYFPDRDALVLAAMQRCHEDIVGAFDEAGAAQSGPAAALRAGMLAIADWAREHQGLYKVLHESQVNRRLGMPFKNVLASRVATAVQRCMDAGVAPAGDAATVALDLRAAVQGALSLHVNAPDMPWPPVVGQIDRFLVKIVGLTLV